MRALKTEHRELARCSMPYFPVSINLCAYLLSQAPCSRFKLGHPTELGELRAQHVAFNTAAETFFAAASTYSMPCVKVSCPGAGEFRCDSPRSRQVSCVIFCFAPARLHGVCLEDHFGEGAADFLLIGMWSACIFAKLHRDEEPRSWHWPRCPSHAARGPSILHR